MEILENYKKNKFKGDLLNIEKSCKVFFERKLITTIGSEFLKNNVPNVDKTLEKVKNLCRVDKNIIYFPIQEVCDILNFSIETESQLEINKINSEKNYTISKFSDVLENGITHESFGQYPDPLTESQIKDLVYSLAQSYTSDVVEKNGNLIITFC